LKTLDLTNTKFDIIHKVYDDDFNVTGTVNKLDGLTSLETLKLAGCGISHFNINSIRGLSNLTTLDLSNNNITNLYDDFSFEERLKEQNPWLTNVKLDNQRIVIKIKENVGDISEYFQNKNVSVVNELYLFTDSGVESIDANQFVRFTNLEKLHFTNESNRYHFLTTINDGAFNRLEHLEDLILHGSQVTSITSHTFDGLTNLKVLSLTNTHITTLTDDVFANLTNLHTLVLTGMSNLKSVSTNVFTHLINLRQLELFNVVHFDEYPQTTNKVKIARQLYKAISNIPGEPFITYSYRTNNNNRGIRMEKNFRKNKFLEKFAPRNIEDIHEQIHLTLADLDDSTTAKASCFLYLLPTFGSST